MSMFSDKRHPCLCFYPNTVILVDDIESQLETFSDGLEMGGMHCQTYTEAQKALAAINDAASTNFWLNHINNSEKRLSGSIPVDLGELYKVIYCLERFCEIGVAVFDKQMPEMDGIKAILGVIQGLIKLIMLTGYHDTDDLMKLMIEGKIFGYVNKQQDDADEVLLDVVKHAQWSYFYGDKHVSENADALLPKLYGDMNFITLHSKICDEYNCIEHYALDRNGSSLLLDASGTPHILAIIPKEQIEAYQFEIQHTDIKPSQELIDTVMSGKKMPFFCNINRQDIEPHQWEEYLVNVRAGQGSGFVYALIDDVEKYGIEKNKIKSYNEFLETLEK